MTKIQNIIEDKLKSEYSPSFLEVINDSHKHKGHVGDDGTGESHFSIKISSKKFEGKSKIACHRMLLCSLEHEVSAIHAVSLYIIK